MRHLLRRAALSAEFALAQYLVKGMAAGNQDMIDEAESMLATLAEDVAEHGGQPISVEPLPQPVAAPEPGTEQDIADAGAHVDGARRSRPRRPLRPTGRRPPSARSRFCPWSRSRAALRLMRPRPASVPAPRCTSRLSPAKRGLTSSGCPPARRRHSRRHRRPGERRARRREGRRCVRRHHYNPRRRQVLRVLQR